MFTGIVEELGRVRTVARAGDGARLAVACEQVLAGLEPGGSVAVDGCCLTAVSVDEEEWCADVVGETLRRTALGELRPGDRVNLERPVRADGRLDGHLVQGHVDAVGTIDAREPREGGSFALRLGVPEQVMRYVVEKGSVAVDGVSLTVVGVLPAGLTAALIPHTAATTTLGHKRVGAGVNVEADLVAKYVERLVRPHRPDG